MRIFVNNLRRRLRYSAASPASKINQRGGGYRIARQVDR